MTDARTFWQTLYERFDPEEPVTEPSWRAPREYSPAADILGSLGRSFGEKKYLFYGGVGTGKSTELLHIAEQRSADSFVVVVDLDRHFSTVIGDPDALLSVQAWEVVLLIALGVLRATSEKLGHKWTRDELEPLRAAITAFTGEQGDSAKIDIMKLASSVTVFVGGAVAGPAAGAVVGKGIELLGKAVGASSWNLLLGRRRRVDDQDERAGALLAAVNDLLRHVATSYYGEVTVLVDGLDRLEDLEAIEALFVRSRLLSMPDDDSVPHLLRNWWLMPYPNRSVWWQPHPLLMISALAESDHS